MQFSESFIQHYFLEVESDKLAEVAETLLSSEAGKLEDAGEWAFFAWLDRPSLWCLRTIQRTSGLDLFLIDDGGLSGVIDVAEMIVFPLDRGVKSLFCRDWDGFLGRCSGDGTLFATFLWLDWDNVLGSHFWGGGQPPPRSEILNAVCCCLEEALPRATKMDPALMRDVPALLMSATAGDADLTMYGWVNNSADLDAVLLVLSLLDVRSIARQLDFHDSSSQWPVFRTSQTELAVPLKLYCEVRAACGREKLTQEFRDRLCGCFRGDLYVEVGLARGRASIGMLKDGLCRVAGDAWKESAVFGGEDLVLTMAQRSVSFAEVVELIAKIEAEGDVRGQGGFVRRSSLKLGVISAIGSRQNVTTEELYGLRQHGEHSDSIDTLPESFKPSFKPSFDDRLLEQARAMIRELSNLGWREDVRIVERMIERCVTLQKAPELRRETRTMVAKALKRILRRCQRVMEMTQQLHQWMNHEGNHPDFTDGELEYEIQLCCNKIRRLREGLLSSGITLDAALSHHSKGVVALLLHPANQARGSEHIGSEVGLSLGMGLLFQSATRRVRSCLPTDGDEDTRVLIQQMREELMDIETPTIFASHDTDFSINAGMGMLRVPRWSLWYPSASCHLMHEFGHALASIAGLSYLLTAVMRQLGDHHSRNSNDMQTNLGGLKGLEDVVFGNQSFKKFVRQKFFEKADKPDPKSGVLDEVEEICCDVVSRMFAYPPCEEWDQRWLQDTFSYVLPFAGRRSPESIHERILRLMTAFVAVRLIRDGRLVGEMHDLNRLNSECIEHTYDFTEKFENWMEETKESKKELPGYISQSLSFVQQRLPQRQQENISHCNTDKTDEMQTWFLHCGLLAAMIFSVKPLASSADVSGFKSSQVWGRLRSISGFLDKNQPDGIVEDDIVVDLIVKRVVPGAKMVHPERLPCLVAARFELRNGRVPPAVRIAMAFYLHDKYNFSI